MACAQPRMRCGRRVRIGQSSLARVVMVPRFMRILVLVLLVACEGPAGVGGSNALVSTSAEPPGVNCPNGGTKIDVGIDRDGNDVLDPSEVTGTSYACNGAG